MMSNVIAKKFTDFTTGGMREIGRFTMTSHEALQLLPLMLAANNGNQWAIEQLTWRIMDIMKQRGFEMPEDRPENTIAITSDKQTNEIIVCMRTIENN